jgi:hypothetical protein
MLVPAMIETGTVVSGGGPATAVASMPAPVVSTPAGVFVAAQAATASAAAPAPVVSTGAPASPIRQVKSGTFTGVASFNATFDAPTLAGSLVYVAVFANTVVNTPAGYTSRNPQVEAAGHYVFDRAAAGAISTLAMTCTAGTGVWHAVEVVGGTYNTSGGQHSGGNPVTSYGTPSVTPSAGARAILASIGFESGGTGKSITAWTNSFTELGDLEVAASGENPVHGVAVLTPTANGSTAYSTTATVSASSVWPSAIIAAYNV